MKGIKGLRIYLRKVEITVSSRDKRMLITMVVVIGA